MHTEALIDQVLDRSVIPGHANGGAPWVTYALTSVAVGVTAAAGARAVDPDSAWYRGLAKPPWQPPPRAFGVIWTPLYASIAWASGRALRRAGGRQRIALIASLAANLTLNAAWNWMFFGLRSPRAGLTGTVLLDISNAGLIRRAARTDPGAAASLVPYTLWCAFATVLNADIVRRNHPLR
jgi:tryptophan-rich sensory protein